MDNNLIIIVVIILALMLVFFCNRYEAYNLNSGARLNFNDYMQTSTLPWCSPPLHQALSTDNKFGRKCRKLRRRNPRSNIGIFSSPVLLMKNGEIRDHITLRLLDEGKPRKDTRIGHVRYYDPISQKADHIRSMGIPIYG